MDLTGREFWGLIHGMGAGAVFLLAFAGGFAGLWSLRSALVTEAGVVERVRRLRIGTTIMAAAAWVTVFTGTWIVYPWYRDAADPSAPKNLLLASPNTANWHDFGMEWKEHIAWIAPLLATAVAFAVIYYGKELIQHQKVRRYLLGFFTASVAIAGVAGLFGALITKIEPVR
jgi:hypothetical protein